tara:strand:- start:437 stop:757 length:321 start_codon:yes stop_codon:yes gene_type:complete
MGIGYNVEKLNKKTQNVIEWENLESNDSLNTIEQKMIEELQSKDPEGKVGTPTKYFKDNYKRIFGRTSNNPQPRLNKSMLRLQSEGKIQIKKVSNRNYIRLTQKGK